jgi:hypothetical protein
MLDFSKVPVIDNHSHPFDLEKVTLDADSLAKVFFHGMGDIPRLAAKTAKLALAEALGDTVRLGLLTFKQAEKAGRMILHENAARMYGLGEY